MAPIAAEVEAVAMESEGYDIGLSTMQDHRAAQEEAPAVSPDADSTGGKDPTESVVQTAVSCTEAVAGTRPLSLPPLFLPCARKKEQQSLGLDSCVSDRID